jgi:hypothetical protein
MKIGESVHIRYVRFERIFDYMNMGWMVDGELPNHHGYWSCAMIWLCDCPVPG